MISWKENGRHLFAQADFWPRLELLADENAARIFAHNKKGGELAAVLKTLPEINPSVLNPTEDKVTIGTIEDIDNDQAKQLQQNLRRLMPWRKGPFELFGTTIDSEWVSSLKWNRLKNHIAPLNNRRILDIGCSNGYYMFRMAASRPELILGIEPYPLFFAQFLFLQYFARENSIFCLPAKLEDLTFCGPFFDTVFCMGILYHQRSPLDALNLIHSQMTKGGELVLETLVLPGDEDLALSPAKRYAKMNNVFFIPTVACLINWLHRTGFEQIRCISVDKTTSREQRKTDWIASQSLDSFLDPDNPDLTIEGYPAPTRALILAEAK